MKNGKYLCFMVLVTFLVACSPVRVFLEKEELSATQEFKTFMVINEYSGKNAYGSPELEASLQRSLIQGLEDRGFELDIKEPDLVVRYNTILSQNQKELNTMAHNPWGWGMYNPWMWRNPYGFGQGGYKTEKYNLGEVVMDFIDTTKDQAVLRISAVGEVTKPEQMEKNIRVSVDKILNEFSKRITS